MKTKSDVIQKTFIRHPREKDEPLVFTHNQVLQAMKEYADQYSKDFNDSSCMYCERKVNRIERIILCKDCTE